MKLSTQLSIFVAALAVAGCHSGHSLVGKWTTNYQGKNVAMEFTSDSNVSMSIDEKSGPVDGAVTFTGTYTVNQDSFSVKVTDMKVKVKSGDASQQAAVENYITGQKQKILDDMNKEGISDKLVWQSDDVIETTEPDGKKGTMTRVKG